MASLRIAQLIADTEAEGPGKRFAIWVQGCSLRCPGCCNPEMFADDRGTALTPAELAQRVADTAGIEGISVLGGEPFEQAEGVAELCRLVRAQGRSVMVYTGYTLAELKGKQSPHVDALLAQVDLLVDGRFEQHNPERARRWIGSRNQVLHFFTPRYSPDEPRFSTPNTVELRFVNGQLTINGWPQAADALRKR